MDSLNNIEENFIELVKWMREVEEFYFGNRICNDDADNELYSSLILSEFLVDKYLEDK